MRSPSPVSTLMLAAFAAWAFVSPAGAQRLGGGPALPLPNLGQITQPLTGALRNDLEAAASSDALEALRETRLRDLVRANPKALEMDALGAPVVRGEVMAIDPTEAALTTAQGAGFAILRRGALEGLDLQIVVLAPPEGVAAKDALRRLRRLDPKGRYDLDHIYAPSGTAAQGPGAQDGAGEAGARAPRGGSAAVGLLDTGIAADHPCLAASLVAQRGFAAGGLRPGAHGTAVASLMVGASATFRGADPGARLYAADVYGAGPTGGSVDAIVHALAWMAQSRVTVINISLVGPPNLALEAAVRSLTARGALIVAPVGNDGPAAPPLYPASYPGVIAVTATDRRGRLLLEAGHAQHIDFAAPGADLSAAQPGGGYGPVRGTSFASPIVAGLLARLSPDAGPRPGDEAEAVAALVRLARSGGRDLGHGLVGAEIGRPLRAQDRQGAAPEKYPPPSG